MTRKRSAAGFTLIELVVSVGILSLLLAAFYTFYRNQAFSLLRQHVEVNTKESAEIGLDFVLRELRMAGARPRPETYPPAGCTTRPAVTATPAGGCSARVRVNGFPWITAATATSITFQYDFRGDTVVYPTPPIPDGCPDDADERITYSYDGVARQILRRSDVGATLGTALAVVDNVPAGGFELRYFTEDNTELTPGGGLTTSQINQIWSIRVTVRSQNPNPHEVVPGGVAASETTTIHMRNPEC